MIDQCLRLKRSAFKDETTVNQVSKMALEALNLYLEMAQLAKNSQLPLFIN